MERKSTVDLTLRQLAVAFACLFVVLAFLLPAAGFYDLYLLPWQARTILTDNANLWHAMRDNPAAYLPGSKTSALPYGPLFYYPLSLWLLALDTVRAIDLDAWADFSIASSSLRYTALLKMPNLAIYLAVGLALLRTFPGRAGQDAMLLWLLNPAVIIISFVMGQNDGWSMLSVLLALLLAAKASRGEREIAFGRWRAPVAPLALVILGAGGAIKLHPLLLMAPFAIALGQSWRERVLLGALGLGTFALLIAPFASDAFFRKHALMNSQGGDIFSHRLLFVPVFLPAYALAVAPSLRRGEGGLSGLLASVVAVHLLVFALTDWNPERAVWFIGALALPATMSRAALAAYLLTTVQALLRMMAWGGSLGTGAFALLSPRLGGWPALEAALDRAWDFDHLYLTCASFAILAWTATVLLLTTAGTPRPRPVSIAVPLVALALLPAYFGGAIAYGAGGLTAALPGPAAAPITGPAVVEQEFPTYSFSAIDVAYVSDGRGGPLRATVLSNDGTRVGEIAVVDRGDGYVRLRFGEQVSNGLYRLRLEVPAGASVRTITSPFEPALVGGAASGRTVDLRLHTDVDWDSLRSDVGGQLKQGVPVFVSMGLVLAIALALVCREAVRACPTG